MVNEIQNLKVDINSKPIDVVNSFLSSSQESTMERQYVGVVEDNNDPEKLGRCKIRVFGEFDEIPTKHIPWAVPDFSFIGSLKGSFIVPVVGAIVNVYFEKDELYLPRYSTKVLNRSQLPKNKDIDYPHNMVFFETDAGDSFEINRRRNTATFTHSSGTTIKIDKDGSVNILSASDITTDHEGLYTMNGNTVKATGYGGLCAKRICPFDGTFHTGIECTSINTYSDGDFSDEVVVE